MKSTDLRISSLSDLDQAATQARSLAAAVGLSAREAVGLAGAVRVIAYRLLECSEGGTLRLALEGAPHGETLCLTVEPASGHESLSALDLLGPEVVSGLSVVLGLEGVVRHGAVCFLKRLPADRAVAGAVRAAPPISAEQSPVDDLLFLIEDSRWKEQQIDLLQAELDDTNHGVMALYEELEDRAQLEQQLRETQRRFMAHLTHEFRTPLSSLLALSEILLARYDGELTPEQEKQITLMRSSAADMNQLVDDLLDLTKAQAGATAVRLAAVDVPALFRSLRGLMRPLVGSDEVALVFDDPVGLPEVTSDRAKLAQILRNLISNALKFTRRGEVRVSARLSADGGTVVFTVADTGIGIAPADQRHIFDDFARVESAGEPEVKGTGLGLPLARRLAELLGGSISLQSTLGGGSVFSVETPVTGPGPDAQGEGAQTGEQT